MTETGKGCRGGRDFSPRLKGRGRGEVEVPT